MDESILSSIVNFMTNTQLDKKLLQDSALKNLMEKELVCEKNFRDIITSEQLQAYINLSDLTEQRASRYSILAYQQGMKDLFCFFLELAGQK